MQNTSHPLARDYLGRFWTLERDQEWNMFCALQSSMCVGVLLREGENYYHMLYPSALQYRERLVCTERGKRVADELKKEK